MKESDEHLSLENIVKRNDICFIDEWKKRQEDIRRMIEKISETEEAINILKEKLERKEDKLAYLREQVMGSQLSSTLAVVKLQYKISDYNGEIQNLRDVITELMEFSTTKKNELQCYASAPFVDQTSSDDQDGDDLLSLNNDTSDDCSILDMMCCYDSDPEDNENEDESVYM